jgi:hypothetical protein
MNENNKNIETIKLATNEEYCIIDRLVNLYELNTESETFDVEFINVIIDSDLSLFTKEECMILSEMKQIANEIKNDGFKY